MCDQSHDNIDIHDNVVQYKRDLKCSHRYITSWLYHFELKRYCVIVCISHFITSTSRLLNMNTSVGRDLRAVDTEIPVCVLFILL